MFSLKVHLVKCALGLPRALHLNCLLSAFQLRERGSELTQVLVSPGRFRTEELNFDLLIHIVVTEICTADSAHVPSGKPVRSILAHFRLIDWYILARHLRLVHDEKVEVARLIELGNSFEAANLSVRVVLHLFRRDFDK